jgi:hypothetical protein
MSTLHFTEQCTVSPLFRAFFVGIKTARILGSGGGGGEVGWAENLLRDLGLNDVRTFLLTMIQSWVCPY